MLINEISFGNIAHKKQLENQNVIAAKNSNVTNLIKNSADEFVSSSKQAESRDSFNSWVNKLIGYNTGCSDNNDDGKLSFKEKLTSIGRGCLNLATNTISAIKEHPVKTIATTFAVGAASTLAVSAGIISAPALAGIGASISLFAGGFKVIQGIKNASNAKTDAEAKLAYESIGEGGGTAAISAVALNKSVKVYKKELSEAKALAKKSADSAQKSADWAERSAEWAKENKEFAEKYSRDAFDCVPKANKAAKVAQQNIKRETPGTKNYNKLIKNAEKAEDAAKSAHINAGKTIKSKNYTLAYAGKAENMANSAQQSAKTAGQCNESAESAWSLIKARRFANSAKDASLEATSFAKQAQEAARNSKEQMLNTRKGYIDTYSDYLSAASKAYSEEIRRNIETKFSKDILASYNAHRLSQESLNKWGLSANDVHQLIKHYHAYLAEYPDRISSINEKYKNLPNELKKQDINTMDDFSNVACDLKEYIDTALSSDNADTMQNNVVFLDNVARRDYGNGKVQYWISEKSVADLRAKGKNKDKGILITLFDGKFQSMMNGGWKYFCEDSN